MTIRLCFIKKCIHSNISLYISRGRTPQASTRLWSGPSPVLARAFCCPALGGGEDDGPSLVRSIAVLRIVSCSFACGVIVLSDGVLSDGGVVVGHTTLGAVRRGQLNAAFVSRKLSGGRPGRALPRPIVAAARSVRDCAAIRGRAQEARRRTNSSRCLSARDFPLL